MVKDKEPFVVVIIGQMRLTVQLIYTGRGHRIVRMVTTTQDVTCNLTIPEYLGSLDRHAAKGNTNALSILLELAKKSLPNRIKQHTGQ